MTPDNTIDSEVDQILKPVFDDLLANREGMTGEFSGNIQADLEKDKELTEREYAEAAQSITNLIAQEANKARLEHSIGILDNVIMLGKDLEYPKEALIDACVRQRDELIKQIGTEV